MKPQLVDEYVKTGKVHFEFRDYAFLGVESKLAAQAAECAAQQDKFWNFHNTIFLNQGQAHDDGSYSADRLRKMAEDNGLDLSAYDTCMASDASKKVVDDSLAEAQGLGVSSTPSVFVDGQKVDWKGWDTLKAAIDAELAKK